MQILLGFWWILGWKWGLGLLGPALGLRVPRLCAAALRGQHHGGASGAPCIEDVYKHTKTHLCLINKNLNIYNDYYIIRYMYIFMWYRFDVWIFRRMSRGEHGRGAGSALGRLPGERQLRRAQPTSHRYLYFILNIYILILISILYTYY